MAASAAAKTQDTEDDFPYQDVDAMFSKVDQQIHMMEKHQHEQELRSQRFTSVARERMFGNIQTMKRHFKALTQSLACELDSLLKATEV
jgi:hypothetical protein